MEHQILPQGVIYGEESSIPYIGKTDYVDIPFLEYSKSAGYTFLHGDGGKPWVDHMQVAKESPSPEFLQTWLFYGLLQETLGRSLEKYIGISLYNHADFIRCPEVPLLTPSQHKAARETKAVISGRNFITTAKLNELLEQWSHLVRPQLDTAEPLFSHVCACLMSVAAPVLRVIGPKLDPQLLQCLCSTMELLGLVLENLFSNQSYANDKNCIPAFDKLVWTNERIERMMSKGWCPFQGHELLENYRFLQALLYMENLEKPKPQPHKDRHENCNVSQCRGLQVPVEPQHRHSNCQCDNATLDSTDSTHLVQILYSGKVPVLHLSNKNGVIRMEVAASGEGITYIALSHVWADGLGNKSSNSLQRCQIDYIYHRLKAVQKKLNNDDPNVYVWIDTICCPLEPELQRKALALMVETYKNAAVVLVLDAELEMTDCDALEHIEILTRISCSTWMRRLWTLQEALLAKNLWVQFRTEALDLDQLVEDHHGIDSRVQARMLHKLVKNKIFGIRRNRISKPLSRTQIAHIIGVGIQDRFVSVPSDEPLCLSTVFELHLATVAKKPPEQRMQEFWRILSESTLKIPSVFIFSGSQRLSAPGYRWAPSTIIDSHTPILLSFVPGNGELCAEGLKVNLPGVLLSSLGLKCPKTPPNSLVDRPTYLRDKTGTWYIFSTEDNHAAQEIANRTNSPVPEVVMKMPNPLKDHLPEDYSRYAIIGSQPRTGALTRASRAILALIRVVKDDGTIFVNRVHCVQVPCLLGPSMSEPLEAAFKYTMAAEESEAQKQGVTEDIGRHILEANPGIQKYLRHADNPAAYMQEYVELMRRGRLVAIAKVLDSAQRWCID